MELKENFNRWPLLGNKAEDWTIFWKIFVEKNFEQILLFSSKICIY